MLGLRASIGSRSQSWSAYWKGKDNFYELWKITGAGSLIGLKRGDTLTVGGTAGSYTFQVPNTTPYKTRDTDKIFFRTDASQRTTTEAELVGYDFPRVIVLYQNVAPYSIIGFGILDTGQSVNDKMRDDFDLSLWWDNTLSSHGVVKGNRGVGQSVWILGEIISASIANATPTKIAITFNAALDETSVPAASAFILPGLPTKTISNVAISGAVVTLTVTVAYIHYNVVTASYVIPVTNYLKKVTGEEVESFTAHAVTNNVTTALLTGLLNYYKFNETSGDLLDVVSANNGVITGATRGAEGATCYSFDGNDSIALTSAHTFLTTQSFTFALWVKNDAINTSEYFLAMTANVTKFVQFYKINAGVCFRVTSTGDATVTYTNILTAGDWIFIAGVRNVATDKINVYVNGVAWGTPVTDASTTNVGAYTIKIGRAYNDTLGYNGKMKKLGIWTKALTDSEILELYNGGLGNAYPF
jgi:hypothetical protein